MLRSLLSLLMLSPVLAPTAHAGMWQNLMNAIFGPKCEELATQPQAILEPDYGGFLAKNLPKSLEFHLGSKGNSFTLNAKSYCVSVSP